MRMGVDFLRQDMLGVELKDLGGMVVRPDHSVKQAHIKGGHS